MTEGRDVTLFVEWLITLIRMVSFDWSSVDSRPAAQIDWGMPTREVRNGFRNLKRPVSTAHWRRDRSAR
jgi:hypothetical protein